MAMICVTIGRGRHSSLAEEWEQAAKAGVDLVELRIDCLRRDPDLKRILKDRPTPLVFTIRRGVGRGSLAGQRGEAPAAPPRGDRPGRRLRRPGVGHRHQDPPLRQDQADRQLPQPEDDAGRRPGHRREVRGGRPGHRQGRHRGDDPGRGVAGAPPRRDRQVPDDPDRDGGDRGLHPDPGCQVRRAVHLRRLQSRAELRPGDAPVSRPEEGLLLQRRSTPRPRSTVSSATRSSRA